MTDYIKKMNHRGCNGFDNYIEQIRFPFFKKITKNQVIDFNYPFIALVGPNGSGKTSVLQALYGATLGKSVSDFWFSTSIDPILESGSDINRFIYKFKPKGYSKSVEVLNKRTQRRKTEKQDADPDYWESARPSVKDGMDKMLPYDPSLKEFRNETRWKQVSKTVTYIDFRAEISAFDKCFYFGDFTARPTIKTKKDFLRHRSAALDGCIKSNVFPRTWHSRTLKKLRLLTEIELQWINSILNKSYVSAKIVSHNFYNQTGFSIIFSTDNQTYSEAVAGSGEVAVVTSVIKILSSKPHSLILLDEPEVSLHPGAQLRLRDLLFYKVTEDNCQVVVSTHSENFLKDLPNKAVKLFYRDEVNNTYSVAPEASAEQAFFRIGGERISSRIVYVEDDLAQLLVETAIEEIDVHAMKDITITSHPGGARTIIKNLSVSFALSETATQENSLVLLDGDMNPNANIIRAADIPLNERDNLNRILKEQTGVSGEAFNLPLNGGNASPAIAKEQKNELLLKALDAFHDHFNFMNVDTPEELIWKISSGSSVMQALCSDISSTKYKDKFIELSRKISPKEPNAETILTAQTLALTNRDKNHPIWLEFKDLLKDILNISDIG